MTNGIRLLRKPESVDTEKETGKRAMKTILEEIDEESSMEMSTEDTRTEEQELQTQSKFVEEDPAIIVKKFPRNISSVLYYSFK